MDHRHLPPLRQLAPRRPRGRRPLAAPLALATGAALCVGGVLAGCSSSSTSKATSTATSAASAAQSLASQAASAAQSLASQGSSAAASVVSQAAAAASSLASSGSTALASAQSAAASALASATGGFNASDDVSVGQASINSDSRAQVQVTVTNHQSQAERYVIEVNFKDSSGTLLDTSVLTVPSLQPNGTTQATVTSTMPLSGNVTASVGHALGF
ncbi:hypothetical protein [Kitasatospora sp. NBC_01266]|uniref:hypothetical protein n=1 Tax=Kitasatospora sp. NBC_01266 TaxID=2903572 RepID=UPI002E3353B9|nr:hypothetical protein [Kitasatospora sp. NBC_01266]